MTFISKYRKYKKIEMWILFLSISSRSEVLLVLNIIFKFYLVLELMSWLFVQVVCLKCLGQKKKFSYLNIYFYVAS